LDRLNPFPGQSRLVKPWNRCVVESGFAATYVSATIQRFNDSTVQRN